MWPAAFVTAIVMLCISGLLAWRWWIDSQPACTAEEFKKVVDQCNLLTSSMAEVKATADSVRSAVGLARMRG